MIQVGSTLHVLDNSGGRKVVCIGVLSGYKQRYANIGDVITVSVKMLRTRRRTFSKVKKGEVVKALIIHTKSLAFFKCSTISFLANTVVLLNNQNKPIGTRIFGALPKLLRKSKYLRLLFLSRGIIN